MQTLEYNFVINIVIERALKCSRQSRAGKLLTNVIKVTILDHHSRAKALLRDDYVYFVIARAFNARGNPG